MKYVLDTSIIIDHLRGSQKGDAFFSEKDSEVELFIPSIVIFELFSGTSTRNPTIISSIRKTLSYFQRIFLTESIAQKAGELFRDTKLDISLADYIIAASALKIGAEVVTLNTKHFAKIPGVRIYDFENGE